MACLAAARKVRDEAGRPPPAFGLLGAPSHAWMGASQGGMRITIVGAFSGG
jgi:hypothetical protein